MKVMTFNILHCAKYPDKKHIDYPLYAETIKSLDADIVGLNEVYGDGPGEFYADQTGILAESAGYPYHYFAQAIYTQNKGPYGNALLSKIPIEHAETILIPDPALKTGPKNYETRCVLKAQLQGGITVLVTHFGLNPDEEINAVLTLLRNAPKQKCIVMGDFNVEPHDGILMPLQDRLHDAAQRLPAGAFTFSTDNPYKKIDYIFVSRDIAVLKADVPQVGVSDHFPHTATIRFRDEQE